MIERVLVTGSSGTIGTRLCERLVREGCKVKGLDRRPNKWSKLVDNITIRCDLLDAGAVKKLPGNFDLVFHLAANSRVMETIEEPEKGMENITTTFNILNFARKNNIKKIAFASSREVYGEAGEKQYREGDVTLDKIKSPYAASKIACEALIESFRYCFDFEYLIFRFSNVYGMYDETDRVIPLFLKLLKQGKPLKIYGREKSLDFIYIDDAIDGVVSAIKRFDRVKNSTFNLCSGKAVKIMELAKLMREITNSNSDIQECPERTGEVSYFRGDFSRAKSAIGFFPKTSLEEGLKRTADWYYKNLYP